MILTKSKNLLVICLFFAFSFLSAQDWAQLGHFDTAN